MIKAPREMERRHRSKLVRQGEAALQKNSKFWAVVGVEVSVFSFVAEEYMDKKLQMLRSLVAQPIQDHGDTNPSQAGMHAGVVFSNQVANQHVPPR